MDKKKVLQLRILTIIGIILDLLTAAGALYLLALMCVQFGMGVTFDNILHLAIFIAFEAAAIIHLIANINLLRKKASEGVHARYSIYVLTADLVLEAAALICSVISQVGLVATLLLALVPVIILLQLLIVRGSRKALSDEEKAAEKEDGKLLNRIRILAAATVVLPAILVTWFAAGGAKGYYEAFKDSDVKVAESLSAFASSPTLDGDTITAEDLKGHKLVFLNCWGTWCHFCKEEMPDLGDLAREYADQDVVFIGVCYDAVNDDGSIDDAIVEEAKQICSELGADYPSILPTDENLRNLQNYMTGFPTTFLLDENGEIVETIEGSRSRDGWIEIIESHLN